MFFEIPTDSIRIDPRFPDKEGRYIYEHLFYFLSRPHQFPLPAIGVEWIDGHLTVIDRHVYLRIAKELGRDKMRIMLPANGATASELVARLPDGSREIGEELWQEMLLPISHDYHVYFFEKPLNPEEQKKFIDTFVGFFENLSTPLFTPSDKRVFSCSFPFDGLCAELELNSPVGDRTWIPYYLQISREFSQNVARIVSFQGSPFFY